MTYQPTAAELAAHTFEFDSATLDKPLADFLQKFYTLSDDRENANSWAACFTEDATMKRKTADAVGRDGEPTSPNFQQHIRGTDMDEPSYL